MRYWILRDGTQYTPSFDDLSQLGFVEITEQPTQYPDLWYWDFTQNAWVLDKTKYIKQYLS